MPSDVAVVADLQGEWLIEHGPAYADLDPVPAETTGWHPWRVPQAAPRDGRCPRATLWKSSCKSRGCVVCGPRWARNQRTKVGTNLEFYGGKFATLCVTAPGKDRLPWDEGYCSGRRAHLHSGARGCRVQQRPLREWCETLTWRWTKLREAAQLATFRKTEKMWGEGNGQRAWVMERCWEPQKRGAPHNHLVLPYGTPRERKVAQVFRDELARLAPNNDFGHVQGKLQPIDGEKAARYIAGYLTGRRKKKNSIRENIADPRLPKSLLWETPVLASVSESPRMIAWRERRGIKLGTGVTMRTLRRMRHLWACIEDYCDELPRWSGLAEAVLVVAVLRRVNPKRAGPLRADWGAVLQYARAVDRQQNERQGGWDLSYYDESVRQWLPNQPLYRNMAKVALRWTTIEPEAAAA